jgi:ankyrin repeat protein
MKAACSLLIAIGVLALPTAPAGAQPVLAAGELPIHQAALAGTGEEVGRIIKADPALRDARNGIGMTPLHLAAMNPNIGPLKVLLAAGADVNARDSEGVTPLHMAAYKGNARPSPAAGGSGNPMIPQAGFVEHAKLLLVAGADPNATSNNGRTPLSMARKARADETAGVISIWILKGCKAGQSCWTD